MNDPSRQEPELSFNPGPSQISAAVLADIDAIVVSGLLTRSHRSAEFQEITKSAVCGLRRAMGIAEEFQIFFVPSATAAMDCVLRNVVQEESFHFVHGAFAQRFALTAEALGLRPQRLESPWAAAVPWRDAAISEHCELVAITQNETSSGLAWPQAELEAFRTRHSRPLLALDLTSSFGTQRMDFSLADLFFASVQKGLGQPAGLGILAVGPRAMARARELGKKRRVAAVQDFLVLEERMANYQTVETPNMLAVALLARQMQRWDLETIDRATREKAELLATADLPWRYYVEEPAWRSATVHNFVIEDPLRWHELARAAGMLLGLGHGHLAGSCLRVANFPAHRHAEIKALIDLLRSHCQ